MALVETDFALNIANMFIVVGKVLQKGEQMERLGKPCKKLEAVELGQTQLTK